MIKTKVPTLFYKDHLARDCGQTGRILKAGKLLTEVELDWVAYQDLITDAEYYTSFKGTEDYAENKSVVDSATATLARLNNKEAN